MAMHFTTPLAHEAVEHYGKDLANHCVGCGPYVMTEYTKKQRIVLEANPNRMPEFYPTEGAPGDREKGLLADAGKQLPLTQTVNISFLKEGTTGWNLFQQGYLDQWVVTQENYQQVMARAGLLSDEMVKKGIKLHRAVTPNIRYFAFNMNDPVVGGYTPQKRKLRQAISMALDAQAYIDLFDQGNGLPAQWIIPPGLAGYDPKFRNPYREYNLDKAKQLLAEAGYPDGIDSKTGDRLTIYFDNAATSAASRQLVQWVQKEIDALGIHLESRVWRDIVWQDRIDKGQFQFMTYGWLADYPDPENFVFLLYGPNKRPGPNASNYANPEYDKLFEKMRSMDDGPAREAIIQQMRAIAVEDCPWIYVVHEEDLDLSYDWIHNVKPHGVANDLVKYRGVNGPERAARQLAWNHPVYWPAAVIVLFLLLGSIPAANVVKQRTNRRLRTGDAASATPENTPSGKQTP
jgi:ABC-type transport system substrate-binding protein